MTDNNREPTQAYTKLAQIYDAIYTEKDYEAESEQIAEMVAQHKQTSGNRMLDVGCGTGGHIDFLRESYAVEGLDRSAEQIAIARTRFPSIDFHIADMVDFELPKKFDVITCLFSAIGYVQSAARLMKTIGTMARHLVPGGVLIVEPWLRHDVYQPGHISSSLVELPELRVARMCVSELRGNVSVMEMHYMVATPAGVETFTDLHELGMFTHEDFVEAFAAAGLAVTHDEEGLIGRGLYIGVKAEQDI